LEGREKGRKGQERKKRETERNGREGEKKKEIESQVLVVLAYNPSYLGS
jgi:hypothetical protein